MSPPLVQCALYCYANLCNTCVKGATLTNADLTGATLKGIVTVM